MVECNTIRYIIVHQAKLLKDEHNQLESFEPCGFRSHFAPELHIPLLNKLQQVNYLEVEAHRLLGLELSAAVAVVHFNVNMLHYSLQELVLEGYSRLQKEENSLE